MGKNKKKKTASGRKQSMSEEEYLALRRLSDKYFRQHCIQTNEKKVRIMNEKLQLIDRGNEFSLKIGGVEVPFVTGYCIRRDTSEVVNVQLDLQVLTKDLDLQMDKDCDLL